jgi:hypothetical protein
MSTYVAEVPGEGGTGGVRVDAAGVLTPWEAATLAREVMAAAERTGPWKTCRYCPAPLLWAKTERGSGMPLDLGDHPGGNMAARTDGGQVVVRSCPPGRELHPGERRVMTHYATCVGADKARKPKPGRKRGVSAPRS